MIAVILGTRPEIIKMSPLIRACEESGEDYFILHTGQHYSYAMDRVFFEELALPAPAFNLDVGSGTHAVQTGAILAGAERIIAERKPDVVLVQGDTNTVLAGALAASKSYTRGRGEQVLVGHVEAGLRSFDRKMPEEINRVLTDHISDFLFAPTAASRKNLLNEGIDDRKIHITGNTIVDAVRQNLALAKEKGDTPGSLGLERDEYILVTLHRQENVDDKARLSGIMRGLMSVRKKFGMEMVFPVHPRTEKMIRAFGIDTRGIRLVPPLGFLEFLQLESEARLALTDSGGVQEECCILSVPCVTIRDSTERPETVDVGANTVAGFSPQGILAAAGTMLSRDRRWENPFGDGRAGERILAVLNGSRG
ncbi:MAG TPA: UDP-N-acetylglucosamine 2-epimerase (non-hydrolyzing) [Methanoregulaceae archaeon]|nr:UDP-N-acetylglucosamine 2-epimerase (non-hydrolyzing) [Methanoregulaceae archaeon]HPD74822.1 UDP-N-acetylglucosamine 2-epimerase (non-hydrolyzing) [Methanoregulaceae archaeon]HRY75305.1 UDP-N-acetylglucosamine 2-epimerase (non-hydrolyzing) [Methanoregulaceae archaeon]